MLNDQVSRIINSNVCQTIANTVSKNHEELQQLQGTLAQRTQQILTLRQRIAEEIRFFQEIGSKNNEFRENGRRLREAAKEIKRALGQVKGDLEGGLGRVMGEVKAEIGRRLVEEVKRIVEERCSQIERARLEESEKANTEIKRLTNTLKSKDQEIRQQTMKIQQLQKINTQLKKQQLSKIFSKKQLRTSLPQSHSRHTTLQSDILMRTFDAYPQAHDNTQNTFTQPNLQQTALMNDFSRKRSLIISPSCTTISVFHIFDFERLSEVSYEGKRLAGKKSAYGLAVYENRFSYEGEFVRDFREGNGILRQGKEVVYSGAWKGGVFHGKGTLTLFPNTIKYKNWKSYTGHFYQGNVQGIGTVTFINGQSLLCNFKSGGPVSKGILYDSTDVYYGEYKNQTFTNSL